MIKLTNKITMKFIATLFSALSLVFGAKVLANTKQMSAKTNFYELSFISLDGKKIDFSEFKGKKVLIVNTASKCGFTPQYADLEKLYNEYKEKVVIVGFPSNDFGGQEPGNNNEIREFCQMNYGVTFLMMSKSDVKGENKNSVYKWLTEEDKNGWNTQEPTWNFCKYLIDENGQLVKFFSSKVKPMDEEIISLL